MKMRAFKLLLLLLLLPSMAFGGVNLKNGNFYISYTDIIVPGGGMDLEITRTNNSKSTEKGWFGFGWGSDYETYVTVSADGSVVVHENGSGALTRFVPKTAVDSDKAAQNIIAAIRKKSPVSEKVAGDLLKKLKNDAELRQAYARKYKVTAKIASGTELFSNTRGLQRIVKTKKGFKRVFNDGKVESFNANGNLVQIKNKNGYKVNLNYKKGRLASIKDSQAKQLFFQWYPDGKVKHISSAGDKKTLYKYRGDDLVESTDIAGNVFKYAYDLNHNMTAVTYTDGSALKVSYTPKTQFVEEVVSRNSESTKYKYESNPKNPELHYWTTVTKKSRLVQMDHNTLTELQLRSMELEQRRFILNVVHYLSRSLEATAVRLLNTTKKVFSLRRHLRKAIWFNLSTMLSLTRSLRLLITKVGLSLSTTRELTL
jgi:YD repeat-containing protein